MVPLENDQWCSQKKNRWNWWHISSKYSRSQVRVFSIFLLGQERQPKVACLKTNTKNLQATTWVVTSCSRWSSHTLESFPHKYRVRLRISRGTRVFVEAAKGHLFRCKVFISQREFCNSRYSDHQLTAYWHSTAFCTLWLLSCVSAASDPRKEIVKRYIDVILMANFKSHYTLLR